MTDSPIIKVTLTAHAYGGEAMGRLPDGRVVFVPFALPGETVRARVVAGRKGFARAELLEIITPAPERIKPRCKHFFSLIPGPSPLGRGEGMKAGATCGGCHYQHLPYAAQLKAKTDILRNQLIRIGKIPNPPVKAIVPAPEQWHYRNHVQFHLDKTGKLGFIAAGSPADKETLEPYPAAVVPIDECFLPETELNALWPQLQFDADSPVERVSLRAGDGLMVILESDAPETPEIEIETDISVVHLTDEDTVVVAGDDHIHIEILGRLFHVSAASFFQVNTSMAAKMVAHLLENLPVSAATTLLDVYCGAGLFSAFFAPKVKRVIGIEVAPSACEDFAINLDEFDNVELYEAPAEIVLPALSEKPEVVIVDPPRAGLDKKVIDAILALRPKTLAYVSCDPATLARDAARLLAGGYKLKQVTPFDLFPQTYHIESISIFGK